MSKFIPNIPHPEKVNYINASDLVVLPTLAEGRPNVVLDILSILGIKRPSPFRRSPRILHFTNTGFLVGITKVKFFLQKT